MMNNQTIIDIVEKYNPIENFTLEEIKQSLIDYKEKLTSLYQNKQFEQYEALVSYHDSPYNDKYYHEHLNPFSVRGWFAKLIGECFHQKNFEMLGFIQNFAPFEQTYTRQENMYVYINKHFHNIMREYFELVLNEEILDFLIEAKNSNLFKLQLDQFYLSWVHEYDSFVHDKIIEVFELNRFYSHHREEIFQEMEKNHEFKKNPHAVNFIIDSMISFQAKQPENSIYHNFKYHLIEDAFKNLSPELFELVINKFEFTSCSEAQYLALEKNIPINLVFINQLEVLNLDSFTENNKNGYLTQNMVLLQERINSFKERDIVKYNSQLIYSQETQEFKEQINDSYKNVMNLLMQDKPKKAHKLDNVEHLYPEIKESKPMQIIHDYFVSLDYLALVASQKETITLSAKYQELKIFNQFELFNIIENYITNKNNLNASWYKNTDYKAQITLNELISLNELMKKTEEAKNLSQQLIKDELKTTISNLREKQNAIDSSFIETNINKKI